MLFSLQFISLQLALYFNNMHRLSLTLYPSTLGE